jgi:hypothetical protein
MNADKPSGELVKSYLKKFPSISSNKLATMLITEYPADFKSHDTARALIRYYRGSIGDRQRSKLTPETYMPKISVPSSDETDLLPYELDQNRWPIIAAGDVHIPYHSQDALEIMLEQAYNIGAKTLLMSGDWIDMYQVSRWQRDPRLRNVKDELTMFNQVLDMIQKEMPSMKIIFKVGNHEARFDNYLMANAPELYDMNEMHLENILKLRERNVDLVKDKRIMKFGHLYIIHGHEYVFSISNPVNPARGLYNRAKKSTICFHHHQTSEHTEPSINGDIVTCWSSGCLCGLKPDYMPLNKWNHGFIEIDGGEDGEFLVRNRRIVNYKIV